LIAKEHGTEYQDGGRIEPFNSVRIRLNSNRFSFPLWTYSGLAGDIVIGKRVTQLQGVRTRRGHEAQTDLDALMSISALRTQVFQRVSPSLTDRLLNRKIIQKVSKAREDQLTRFKRHPDNSSFKPLPSDDSGSNPPLRDTIILNNLAPTSQNTY
jgi:hypothetical protein